MQSRSLSPFSLIVGAALFTVVLYGSGAARSPQTAATALNSASQRLSLTPEQAEILSHLSLVYLDDGTGNLVKTIEVSGVNLRIVNGLGDTQTTDGTGNLIVGYNEFRFGGGDERSGSHNIVCGHHNNYTATGGLIAGVDNTISADFATVSGGALNTASANWASISGGVWGTASGQYSSISGGNLNSATLTASSVSGGGGNVASGDYATVSGGANNLAEGNYSSIAGGDGNTADGFKASVSGGADNMASGLLSTVGGGRLRIIVGQYNWRAGTLFQSQ